MIVVNKEKSIAEEIKIKVSEEKDKVQVKADSI